MKKDNVVRSSPGQLEEYIRGDKIYLKIYIFSNKFCPPIHLRLPDEGWQYTYYSGWNINNL